MLTNSAILYHAYSGDPVVMDRVREMLDHMLANGTTDATDSWALVPYSSSDAGNPVYRGGTDTIYCNDHKPCGRGDGVGCLEPEKVGELGCAYLQFYEFTLEKKYLQAALHCADALASRIRPGDERHSPWPFRVDAATGTRIREEYTANTIGPIRLFDELIRLRQGDQKSYVRARSMAWRWLMKYPVENQVWTQVFRRRSDLCQLSDQPESIFGAGNRPLFCSSTRRWIRRRSCMRRGFLIGSPPFLPGTR